MGINIKFNEMGILGIVLGIGGAIFAGIQTKHANDIARKLDRSIDTLDKSTVLQVQQSIIDVATNKAVERQVSGAVRTAVDNVSTKIRSDMDSMIRRDVDCVYNELKNSVKDRMAKEVANIDYDELRSEIKEMAKEKVFDEFCRWGNVGKMFGNVARGNSVDLTDVSDILSQFTFDSDRQKALDTIFGNRRYNS